MTVEQQQQKPGCSALLREPPEAHLQLRRACVGSSGDSPAKLAASCPRRQHLQLRLLLVRASLESWKPTAGLDSASDLEIREDGVRNLTTELEQNGES